MPIHAVFAKWRSWRKEDFKETGAGRGEGRVCKKRKIRGTRVGLWLSGYVSQVSGICHPAFVRFESRHWTCQDSQPDKTKQLSLLVFSFFNGWRGRWSTKKIKSSLLASLSRRFFLLFLILFCQLKNGSISFQMDGNLVELETQPRRNWKGKPRAEKLHG